MTDYITITTTEEVEVPDNIKHLNADEYDAQTLQAAFELAEDNPDITFYMFKKWAKSQEIKLSKKPDNGLFETELHKDGWAISEQSNGSDSIWLQPLHVAVEEFGFGPEDN